MASFLFPFCRLWTPHEGGKFNLFLFKNINQFVSEVNKGFQFWNIYGFFKLKDSTLQFFSEPKNNPPIKLKMSFCFCLNLLLIIYVKTWKRWCLICNLIKWSSFNPPIYELADVTLIWRPMQKSRRLQGRPDVVWPPWRHSLKLVACVHGCNRCNKIHFQFFPVK